ncbi:hypothetical protein [Heyndrickxia acidicola]|uniref:ATP synthase F0 subunit 8 n=1 Tax=Heyndrickxia acidicola TaxID=209389 RepID=A0ABU6MCZ8_9BACI|nr:hypothetical protein [Heyndrickxia acidicola]MED1201553.1 hypothetical protein [Heyndrickxia acidicola]
MQYILDFTNDPLICSFYVSIILAIGLAYICNRFIFKPSSYLYTNPSSLMINGEKKKDLQKSPNHHPIILWIIQCVRRKDCPQEDPAHLVSIII